MSDKCKCPSCGLEFRSTAAFDKHRSGSFKKDERRYLSTQEMLERGMGVNYLGRWVTKLMEVEK